MSTLSITARQFKELVAPVLPHAGTDSMLPVLNTVRVETRGRWLVALATDRFRAGVNRIARPDGSPDHWEATIPLAAVKGIISTFVPRRGMDADLSLAIDGGNLSVSAEGAMVGGFFDASFRWALESGEYPKMYRLIADALRADANNDATKLQPSFLAGFQAANANGQGLWFKSTGDADRGPVVVTDGDNFIGVVMPRKGGSEFPAMADWDDVFGIAEAAPVAPVAVSA